MKVLRKSLLSILTLLFSYITFAAQLPIEEIIVIPDKSFPKMRSEIIAAENIMYNIFNNLIKDDEFKIICKKVLRASSHIKRRECEPSFIITTRQGDFRKGMISSGGNPFLAREYSRSDSELNYDLSAKRQEMRNNLADLAMENPELYSAIMAVDNLKNDFQYAKELKFGK